MPKEKWELIYDVNSAGQAELIRLFFVATGVKYTDVKLDTRGQAKDRNPDVGADSQEQLESKPDVNVDGQVTRRDCSSDAKIGHLEQRDGYSDVKADSGEQGRKGSPGTKKEKSRKRKRTSDVKDEVMEERSGSSDVGMESHGDNADGSAAKIARTQIAGSKLPYPSLPVIRKGGLEISHVVVICRHLGEEFGLCPESTEDRLLADQIVQYCQEYWNEGRFVVIGNCLTQDPPLEQGRLLYRDKFVKQRMPMWLSFFEQCLKKSMAGKKFLFGKSLCYADLALYHILDTTVNHYPSEVVKADYMPLLKKYRLRISSISCINRYNRSPRHSVSGYLFHTNF